MKPWHNSSSQLGGGNRMGQWHPQLMQPPSPIAPPGYPCYASNPNASERHSNFNVYWQDQRRVSMPTPPGVPGHMLHQQNVSLTLTHQQRQYQQPPGFNHPSSGYQQGCNGNDGRSYHYLPQPPPQQYPVQPTYHQQQQYPMTSPTMMMYQPQYQQPYQHSPPSMYSMPIQSPSYSYQSGHQSSHPSMHPSQMMPNYHNSHPDMYTNHWSNSTDNCDHFEMSQNNFRQPVSLPSKNVSRCSSLRCQHARSCTSLHERRGSLKEKCNDFVPSKKELYPGKKNVRGGREVKKLWLKDGAKRLVHSYESDSDTGSFSNETEASDVFSLTDGSCEVVREILTRPNRAATGIARGDVLGEAILVGKGGDVKVDAKRIKTYIKIGRLFVEEILDMEKYDEIMLSFDVCREMLEDKPNVVVDEVKGTAFYRESCKKSLGTIFESEPEKEFGKLGNESETSSERSASNSSKLKVISILEKVAEKMKFNEKSRSHKRSQISAVHPRLSRPVSREPRLKDIRNKWNIADKFSDRKLRSNSRKSSEQRGSSQDSQPMSVTTLVPSQKHPGKHKCDLPFDRGGSRLLPPCARVPTSEGKTAIERCYEYDINIDDMVTNICHSSTPSFTSSEEGRVTVENPRASILDSESGFCSAKTFEDDKNYSAIKSYSDDVLNNQSEEHNCFYSESASEDHENVESICMAFQQLSASITAIKERLDGAGSEPQKLIQETEASFLKFQESYLKAKTEFQGDKYKYPADILYDEISGKLDSLMFGRAKLHENYAVIIDYKNYVQHTVEELNHQNEYKLMANSVEEHEEKLLNYGTDFIFTERDPVQNSQVMNYNYYGEFNINESLSHFESRSHFGVTLGTLQYQNYRENILSTVQMPHHSSSFRLLPTQELDSRPMNFDKKRDKVEDIDPNLIDFDTFEMKEDTISASSSESTIRTRKEGYFYKKRLKKNNVRPRKIDLGSSKDTRCSLTETEDEGPWEYLKPGIYPELLVEPDLITERKEESTNQGQKPNQKQDNEQCAVKRQLSDRGSYLQVGTQQKSLVEMMKYSGGVDKNVPFSIKQLETRNLEVHRDKVEDPGRKTSEKTTEKCENWLAESLSLTLKDEKPSATNDLLGKSTTKRIPSLFDVKVSDLFRTRPKTERRKQSASSYGSGDAPYQAKRNILTCRSGSRPGCKKFSRRHKPVSRPTPKERPVRQKHSVAEEGKPQVVSPGQQWQAIAPGMYRTVNQEKPEAVKEEKSVAKCAADDKVAKDGAIEKVAKQLKISNGHKENPPPLSKILASARNKNKTLDSN